MPNNDLSILISTLINQTSKKNLITEVEELTKTLQQKLGNININISGAGLSKLTSQLNQISTAIQKIKIPQFNFDAPTNESKKFLTAIGSIENTLNATGRTAKSTWDEFGRVTVNVTNTSKGLVENFKYQWDAVNQSLVRVNRQQQDNMLSIDQLQAKYKGMVNTLQTGKLGQSINTGELQAFLKNLKDVKAIDGQITAELQAQFNIMKQNAQMTREQINSTKTLKEQMQVLKASSSNSFKQFESSKSFSTLDSLSLSQYNSIKASISSITELTPNAIQALRLLGKQFDELKIKANQSFDLRNAEQTLNNYLVKMQGDLAKFKKQFEGQFSTLRFDAFQQKALGLKIDPSSSNKTADLTAKIKALNTEFGSMKSEAYANGINAANKATMSFGQQIQLIIQKFSMWIGISTVVMGVIHKINESFDYMLEQTKLFTNLQMEMTGQNLNFSEITKAAQEYAQATGTLSSEVLRAVSVFGTYTSKIDEVIQKSQAAVIMANITGKSILEISDDLMSTAFQYKMGADQYLHIVDMYASVARNLQVDFPKAVAELGSGLKYVGAVANSANMPITNVIASLGVLQESTRRTGSQVANGMKTIISRLSRVGDEIDPESFKKVEKVVYDTTGVMLKESEDNLKPVNIILSELAEKWKTLGSVQKAQLAESAAGIYQRNIFISLMENFSKIQDLETEAINSNGVALQKQDIYSKSLFASIQRLQNAFQGLYQNTLSKDFMKGTVDSTTSAISVFSKLSETIGGLPALITASVLAISALSSKTRNGYYANMLGSVSFKGLSSGQQGPALPPGMSNYSVQIPILNKIVSSMKQINALSNTKVNFMESFFNATDKFGRKTVGLLNSLKTVMINTFNSTKSLGVIGTVGTLFTSFGNGIKGATLALGNYITAANMAKIATIGLQTVMSMGMIVAFSLVIGQVFKLADSFIHAKEKQQELFESLKNDVSTLSSELSDSEKLIKTYNSLADGAAKTTEEKEKLADVTEKLSSLYPNSIDQFDAEGKAISLNKEKLEEYIRVKEQELELKRAELSTQFYKTGNEDVNDLLINEKNIKSKMDQLADYERIKKEFLDSGMAETNKSGYKTVLEDINRTEKELLELKSESTKITDELKTKLTATLQNQDGFKDFKPQELDNFVSSLLKSQDVLKQIKKSGNIEIFTANLIDNGFADTFSNINKEFNELSKNTNKTQKDIDDFNNNAVSKLTEKLSYLGNPVAENVAKVIADKFGLSIKEAKEEIYDFNGAIESIQKTTSDTSDKIELYNQLLDKAKDNNGEAAQEALKNAEKNDELYDAIENVNGVLVLNVDKLNKLKNKQIEEATSAIKLQLSKTTFITTETGKRLEQYKTEIDKLQDLIDYQNAAQDASNDILDRFKSGSINADRANKELIQNAQDLANAYIENHKNNITNDKDVMKVFSEWLNIRGKYKDVSDEESSAMLQRIKDYIKLKDVANDSYSAIKDGNFGATKSSKETTNAKSVEALAWEEVTNEIKKYDNALNKLEDTTSNMIKGSKDRRDALHEENLKIKEQIDYLKQQKDGLNSSINNSSYTPNSTGKAKGIVDIALDSLGTPYKWGGNDLKIGVDCSGLVQQAYKEEGVSVPRVTYDQYKQAPVKGLKQNELQPGDLVFFNNLEHVGIYMGSDKFIEAPHTGANVRTSTLSSRDDYYAGARYLSSENTSPTTVNINGVSNVPNNLSDLINKAVANNDEAQKLGITPSLIAGLIDVETGGQFNADAYNNKSGASGLGQFIPETAKEMGLINPQDPNEAIPAIVNYLVERTRNSGNVSRGLSGYGGYGNVESGWYSEEVLKRSNKYGLSPTSVNLSKSELSYEKLLEDRVKHQEEINAKILELEKKFAQNSKEWYTDLWQESDNIISEFENKSNFSKSKSESMSKSSPEYRDELEIQKFNTTGIQKQLEEQAKQMDQAIENMKKGIEDGTFKDEQFLKETIEKRKQLSTEWWNKQKEISDKQAEITSSEVEAVTNKIDEYNNVIAISQSQQEMNVKGTKEYNDALKNETIQYSNIASALKAKQAIYQKELADTTLGTLRYQELQKAIADTTKEILDNEKALYDKKMSIAEDIISIYKDAYEKQKDVALDSIDKQMNAEEKRHDQVTKNLDDEMKQYEDSINEKLDLLDDQANQEDYTQNLTKLQKEESDIQKDINKLLLDDSYEANAKRIELQEELTAKQEEIEKLQTDRSRELRKDNLNDQLDTYKKDNEAKKDSEDDKYDTIKEGLEDQKEITEKYYDNLINDESKYAKIREDIIKGNFSNIQSELTKFQSTANSKFKSLGDSIQNNFINQIKNALSAMQSLNNAGISIGDSSGNSNSGSSSGDSDSGNSSTTHSQYYPYKSQINNIIYDKKMWQQGYETGDQQMMKDAENEAKIYYKQIPDNVASLLQSMNYDSANSWFKDNVYHEGGIVENKPSKIMDIVNKLFNTKSNESVVKMLKGELAIPENNVMKNFMPNMQNFVSSFIPNFNLQPQVAGGGNQIINVNIAKVNTQDQGSLNQFFGTIRTELKRMGK